MPEESGIGFMSSPVGDFAVKLNARGGSLCERRGFSSGRKIRSGRLGGRGGLAEEAQGFPVTVQLRKIEVCREEQDSFEATRGRDTIGNAEVDVG